MAIISFIILYIARYSFSTPFIYQVKKWDFSFASMWNTVVWFMLMNFFVKIVNSTAQRYLKKEQEKHIAALKNKSSLPVNSGESDQVAR